MCVVWRQQRGVRKDCTLAQPIQHTDDDDSRQQQRKCGAGSLTLRANHQLIYL